MTGASVGSGAAIRIVPVTTRAQLRDFLALPARLARSRGAAHWVPLFASDVRRWWRHGGPYPGGDCALYLALRGSAVVGRTTVHTAPRLAAKLRAERQCTDDFLFFGATEFADAAVGAALFGFLEEVARRGVGTEERDGTPAAAPTASGADRRTARPSRTVRLFGPVSLLPNMTGGVVTTGFEHPGFFDAVWNDEATAATFTDAGFTPWGGGRTWEVDIAGIPADRRTPPTRDELARAGVRVFSPWHKVVGPSRQPVGEAAAVRTRNALRAIHRTMNRAFAALPYYTRIDEAQWREQTAGLGLVMDPALVVLAARAGAGDHAARAQLPGCDSFALVIPDPIGGLRSSGGRLDLRAARELLGPLLRRRPRDAVLIIQGTDPEAQGRGLLSIVTRQLFAALHARRYRRLRVTFIAEDNPASSAVFERAGGYPLHTVRFFEKAVRLEGDA